MASILGTEGWRRHANPWSVFTRFAAIPAGILAGWSRVWIGWWAVLPLVLVVVWLIINPFVFKPIDKPTHWISKGILGEQLWLEGSPALATHRGALRVLLGFGILGMASMFAGVIWLNPWLAGVGAVLVTATQVWRIKRFARAFDEHEIGGSSVNEAQHASSARN